MNDSNSVSSPIDWKSYNYIIKRELIHLVVEWRHIDIVLLNWSTCGTRKLGDVVVDTQ